MGSAQRSAIGSLGLPAPTPHDTAEQQEQNRWILLMVVFTVIVGLIIGVMVSVVRLQRAATHLRSSARQYVQLVNSDPADAWESLCSAARAEIPRDAFIERVTNRGPWTVIRGDFRGTGIGWPWSKSGAAYLELEHDGFSEVAIFRVVHEAGKWRVCPRSLSDVLGTASP